jgi:hypothetical protein
MQRCALIFVVYSDDHWQVQELCCDESAHALKIRACFYTGEGISLPLAFPSSLVPITWAIALMPRHLKTRKGPLALSFSYTRHLVTVCVCAVSLNSSQ